MLEDYLEWMSLITMLCKSNNATFLFFDEGSGDPQVRYRLTDFFQGVLEGNMHDETGAAIETEEVIEEQEDILVIIVTAQAFTQKNK